MDLPPVLVLLTENEALIREAVQDALENGGFTVAIAATGEEALAVLNEHHTEIQALVTDITLSRGGRTGWDLAHRARELNPALPVLYMTGGNAHEWRANGVPESVLITKPFAPIQIVTAIAHLLNRAGTPPAT